MKLRLGLIGRGPPKAQCPPPPNRFDLIQCQPANFRQWPILLVMPPHNSEAIGGHWTHLGHRQPGVRHSRNSNTTLHRPGVKGAFDQF
jgi:hypothetical protein